jgi:hypothetical protein
VDVFCYILSFSLHHSFSLFLITQFVCVALFRLYFLFSFSCLAPSPPRLRWRHTTERTLEHELRGCRRWWGVGRGAQRHQCYGVAKQHEQ